ncbi:MAG: GNAT family N-acetyltransferase [Terriglobales bacterium]
MNDSAASAVYPAGGPAATRLRLEVVAGAEDFKQLAPEWRALQKETPRPNIFLSWDWCWTWWQHFGKRGQLRIVTARTAQGKLAGLAPLHVVRRGPLRARCLEFLGYRGSNVCADHLDFLAAGAERESVVGALWEQVRRLPGWDMAALASVAEDSPLRALWPQVRMKAVAAPGESCYYLPLPATAADLWDYLRREHAGTYANQTRDRRQMQRKFDLQFVPVTEAAAVPEAMTELARLHGLAHGRNGIPGSFALPEYRAFHDELATALAARGELYLARLLWKGETAAVIYSFIAGRTMYFYQSGFDPAKSGAGKLLLGWVIEDAVTRLGMREFDFLRGDEPYKTQWTNQRRTTADLRAWRRTPRAWLHHAVSLNRDVLRRRLAR